MTFEQENRLAKFVQNIADSILTYFPCELTQIIKEYMKFFVWQQAAIKWWQIERYRLANTIGRLIIAPSENKKRIEIEILTHQLHYWYDTKRLSHKQIVKTSSIFKLELLMTMHGKLFIFYSNKTVFLLKNDL